MNSRRWPTVIAAASLFQPHHTSLSRSLTADHTVTDNSITIQFNGQAIEVATGTTILQVLELAEMQTKVVAVELNLEIVPRPEHSSRQVADGDVIEAVTLVGGG